MATNMLGGNPVGIKDFNIDDLKSVGSKPKLELTLLGRRAVSHSKQVRKKPTQQIFNNNLEYIPYRNSNTNTVMGQGGNF